ncbi:MAG: hypothetical protein ACE5GE_08180 [Phycisphaerae bacterium]
MSFIQAASPGCCFRTRSCLRLPLTVVGIVWACGLTVPCFAQNVALDKSVFWDDGLSEMCYYDATETIYGKARHYTRVQMINRQWMGPESGVKADAGPGAVAVFKFVLSEQIPTPNYNYRYLCTMFLRRADLSPFKLTATCQEWCGTTFKHLRWRDQALTMQSFSYFGGEADKSWQRPVDSVPFEAVFVLAREAAASQKAMQVNLLPPMRAQHEVVPDAAPATLTPATTTTLAQVPFGTVQVRRVTLAGGGGGGGWFDVEAEQPHRLIAFDAGGISAKLRATERRAYWDRKWKSIFYKPNQAP